jgi:hypothetical protein
MQNAKNVDLASALASAEAPIHKVIHKRLWAGGSAREKLNKKNRPGNHPAGCD